MKIKHTRVLSDNNAPEKDDLQAGMRAEADFFNKCADNRSKGGHIPYQADIRRASRVIGKPGTESVDPKIYEMQQGKYRDRYIDLVAHQPGGRVLDIGCGPGWLSLELGRRGQIVDAYDISEKAIALAKQMLRENPYSKGFGRVIYHLKNVTTVDLGENTYDAVSGWAAFHHLPNFHDFMKRIDRALKPSGIIATMDDYPRRGLEKFIERFFDMLLPSVSRSYRDKFIKIKDLIIGRIATAPEVFSPMEEAKYSTVDNIQEIWFNRYELIENIPFNAFAIGVMMNLDGPDWFRYSIARCLDATDKFGICTGLFRPQCRILISRKRS